MSGLTLILLIGAIVWFALFEWFRYRSWLRHRASGFSLGTQGLSVVGTVGAFLLVLAAVLCYIFVIIR